MEYIGIISNVVLAVLTGLYVILTYGLVKETRKATNQSRMFFEKQFLLSTLPHLYLSFHSDNSKLSLTLFNSGDMSAFDVDLIVIGVYNEDEIDIPTFVVKFARSREGRHTLTSTKEGHYGVFDHLYYSVFPRKRKVVAPIPFPILPNCIYCLLQYRNLSGINYSQVYFFYHQQKESKDIYRLSSINPKVITECPRVDYSGNDERKLEAENEQPLPKHIDWEFMMFWKHSISSGLIGYLPPDIEDRGEWYDL